MGRKNLGKKIFGSKKFWVKNCLGHKNFGSKKIFWVKKFWDEKNLGQKDLDPNFFCLKGRVNPRWRIYDPPPRK